MESTFVKQTETYFIGRHNTTTDEHAVMDYNSYLGNYHPLSDIESAKGFADQAKAQKIVSTLNVLAEIQEETYEFYLLKKLSDVTVVV